MVDVKTSDVLFDDMTALEEILGTGALSAFAVNANCDCVSYTSTSDDERDTQTGPGALVKGH